MTKNEYENIGDYIRRIRSEKGISINELVKQSGVSKGYISQIENNKFSPSLDIVRKISNALGTDFYESAWRAGLITDAEIEDARYQRNFSDSMTPEEAKDHEENELKWQIKHWNIKQYQEKRHVRLEDFLNDTRRNFYIDDHKLSNEEIRMLITLFGGKEKNYPSDEQIEKEYEEIKRSREENEKRIADGKTFSFDEDYDINTNEDI